MSVLSYLQFFDPSVDADNPSDEATIAVQIAQQRIDQEIYGGLYEQALALIAAHLLELRRRATAAAASGGSYGVGAPTSVRTGDLSISWAAPANPTDPKEEAAWYAQTEPGRQFLTVRAQILFTPRLV